MSQQQYLQDDMAFTRSYRGLTIIKADVRVAAGRLPPPNLEPMNTPRKMQNFGFLEIQRI
jgi:hypothetical protein